MDKQVLLDRLLEVRSTVDRLWIQEAWFGWEFQNISAQMAADLNDDCVSKPEGGLWQAGDTVPVEVTSEWEVEDGDWYGGKGTVAGACLAGSVLYAQGYSDIRWENHDDVKEICVALYEFLPERCEHEDDCDVAFRLTNAYSDPAQLAVESIVEFNDHGHTTKSDVLGVIDATITKVRAELKAERAAKRAERKAQIVSS